MRKLTLILTLAILLVISSTIAYGSWEWSGDPVGVWDGGKVARVVVDTIDEDVTITFYNVKNFSTFPGITVTASQEGEDHKVCVEGTEFQVIPNAHAKIEVEDSQCRLVKDK